VQLEGLGKLKKKSDLIGTGTHKLLACSIVPQPCYHVLHLYGGTQENHKTKPSISIASVSGWDLNWTFPKAKSSLLLLYQLVQHGERSMGNFRHTQTRVWCVLMDKWIYTQSLCSCKVFIYSVSYYMQSIYEFILFRKHNWAICYINIISLPLLSHKTPTVGN
jgi:hypothetical protein